MRIDPLVNLEPHVPTVALPRPMYRVGAILEAIAIRDVTSGQLWLQLENKQRVPVRVASGNQDGPADGEKLKLRVLRDSPVLALENVDESANQFALDEAFRRVLPQQSSPTPLLANLGWLLRQPDRLKSWPPALQRAIAKVWQSLPNAEQLTEPATLQKALMNSGTFLEANLADGRSTPGVPQAAAAHDYKAALLALRVQLRQLGIVNTPREQPSGPMPTLSSHVEAIALGPASLPAMDSTSEQWSELKQQVVGSLSRVQTNQLLHAQAAEQGLQQWLIELPIQHDGQPELLRFKFERESRPEQRGAENWSVQVALDLGSLGTLHAELQLHSQQGLNVRMRSDSPELIAALSERIPVLNSALQAQGLSVNRILCLHGLPVDAVSNRLNKLLDLHA